MYVCTHYLVMSYCNYISIISIVALCHMRFLGEQIAELKCKLADSRTPVPRKPTEFGEDSKRYI